MATVDDVLNALCDSVDSAFQAAGITNQGLIAPGYPNMPDLTKMMEQVPSQYYVGIVPLPTEKLTTRFFSNTYLINAVEPTMTATVSGNQITFSGTVQAGVNATVVLNGGTPNGPNPVTYQSVNGDTLSSVATGVAAKINTLSGYSASAIGAVVTITGASSITCDIGGSATTGREAMRTERHFQISCWCPDPPTRSAMFRAIKLYFATVYFLQFPDTSKGRLKYVTAPWHDEMQRDTLYSAILVYSVDWGEIVTDTQTQITATQITTQATLANGETTPSITITEG